METSRPGTIGRKRGGGEEGRDRQRVTLCGERLNTYVSTDDCTLERRTAFRVGESGGRNFRTCM